MKNLSSKSDWYGYNYTEKIVLVWCGYWIESHTESHKCLNILDFSGFMDSVEEAANAGKF